MSNLNCENKPWDREEMENKQSVLDLVEILDLEDDALDEESWLYESLKKPTSVERESASNWCRHILDNPSPEMEAACRRLMKKLSDNSKHNFYRHETVSHHAPSFSLDPFAVKATVDTSIDDSDDAGHDALNLAHDSIITNYKLQDITDVHIMAKIQEASLRQDFVSGPATASLRRKPEKLPSCIAPTVEYFGKFAAKNENVGSIPSLKPAPSSLRSSRCQSPTSSTKQGCQSPKLSKLHQQVTQFKLLKLAQNQGACPRMTRSPLRTSLRSLQAVRNSRSLEVEDYQPVDQLSFHFSGVSPARIGSSCGSSTAALNSNSSSRFIKESSTRVTAIKKLQRSQSLSPCRIPHSAKGYLSVNGRIFASPESPTTAAWGRDVRSIQR